MVEGSECGNYIARQIPAPFLPSSESHLGLGDLGGVAGDGGYGGVGKSSLRDAPVIAILGHRDTTSRPKEVPADPAKRCPIVIVHLFTESAGT